MNSHAAEERETKAQGVLKRSLVSPQSEKLNELLRKHAHSISSTSKHRGTLSFGIVLSRRLMLQRCMQARRKQATFLWWHFEQLDAHVNRSFSLQAVTVLEKKKRKKRKRKKKKCM